MASSLQRPGGGTDRACIVARGSALVSRIRSSPADCGRHCCELRIRKDITINPLLVWLWLRSSHANVPQRSCELLSRHTRLRAGLAIRESRMRYALLAFAVLLCAGTASAQDYTSSQYCDPWCTQGWRSGALDCSYYTFEQCLAAASGTGAHCVTNPFLSQCQRGAKRPARRRRGN